MNRFILLALLLVPACGPEPGTKVVSKEPTSVRGWISDVARDDNGGTFKTVETEAARRAQLYQSTNIWMDDAPYVSAPCAPFTIAAFMWTERKRSALY